MPMFKNEYPYTNIHEINLDWVIKNVEEIRALVDKYIINYEQITFADPIEWNYLTPYEMHTIVLDQAYNAYLSKQDVPAYTQLNDSDYWLKIGDFFRYIEKALSNLAYNEGDSATATRLYDTGDLLINNQTLYKAVVDIAIGTQFIVDTNIRQVTVEELLQDLQASINTNSDNIAANAENIARNAENIATNAENITANTTAINLRKMQNYTSVADLGLSAGNVTVLDVWNAMPNNSFIYSNANQFTSSAVPSTNGSVFIMKMEAWRGRIEYYGTQVGTGEYRMYLTGSGGTPTGTWIVVSGHNAFTSITGTSSAVSSIAAQSGSSLTLSITIPDGFRSYGISQIYANGAEVLSYSNTNVNGRAGTFNITVWYFNANTSTVNNVSFTVVVMCIPN